MSFRLCQAAALAGALVLPGAGGRVATAAQTTTAPSIVGAWTLDKELSDQPQDQAENDGGGSQGRRDRSGGGFRGGGFGGGRGGFGRGGRGDGARGGVDPEAAARVRTAMRDLTTAAERLTIVQAEKLVIVTSQDGRTTRLAPDGKKIKDESTKIERRTKWDGEKLVSEITGLGDAKITETYYVDPERHQLHVTLQSENGRRPLMLHRVYDAESR